MFVDYEGHSNPEKEKVKGAYGQHGDRLYQVPWPEEQMHVWKDFIHQDRLARRACQVFILKMKASGKELDPKHFSPDEKAQFDKSDQAEWLSWTRNKVVEVVPPDRSKRVLWPSSFLSSSEMDAFALPSIRWERVISLDAFG